MLRSAGIKTNKWYAPVIVNRTLSSIRIVVIMQIYNVFEKLTLIDEGLPLGLYMKNSDEKIDMEVMLTTDGLTGMLHAAYMKRIDNI